MPKHKVDERLVVLADCLADVAKATLSILSIYCPGSEAAQKELEGTLVALHICSHALQGGVGMEDAAIELEGEKQ